MLQRAGWLMLFTMVGLGCSGQSGPQRIAVDGIVDHKAQPLVNGTITIVPSGKQGGPAANGMIEQGKFHIPAGEGPSEGPHTVIINLTPQKSGSHTAGGSPQMPPRMRWEFKVDISREQKSLDLVLEDK